MVTPCKVYEQGPQQPRCMRQAEISRVPPFCPAHPEVAQDPALRHALCSSMLPPPHWGGRLRVTSHVLPRPLNSGNLIKAVRTNRVVSVREVAPTMLLPLSQPPRGQSSWESQRKQCFLPSKLPTIQQLIRAEELHRKGTKTSKKPPALRKRDKQQEGTQRAASLPAQWCVPYTARWGQRISWDKAQPVRQSSSQGGLAFPVTPIRCGDIWEHGLATTAAGCNLLPVLDMGPYWSKLEVRA